MLRFTRPVIVCFRKSVWLHGTAVSVFVFFSCHTTVYDDLLLMFVRTWKFIIQCLYVDYCTCVYWHTVERRRD